MHDEIILEVRKDQANNVQAIVQSIMDQEVINGVSFKVNVKGGTHWGHFE